MGYIPENAEWYVADLIEEISIEGERRNVVHRNCVLIRADSAEEAYGKSMEIGKRGETSYRNLSSQLVRITFRGVAALDVIYEPLEDGCELMFTERVDVSEQEIAEQVPAKEKLGVFRGIVPSSAPDYRSAEVVEDALRLMRKEPSS